MDVDAVLKLGPQLPCIAFASAPDMLKVTCLHASFSWCTCDNAIEQETMEHLLND